MKNKLSGNQIPCEVVRDLFPSYIDGLTSEKTNEMITEHVEECVPCKDILCAMKAPTVQPFFEEDQKEVDFLKKNRRRNVTVVLGSLVTAVMVIIAVLLVKAFFVGRQAYPEMMAWDLNVTGSELHLEVMLGRDCAVSSVDFEEEAGVVQVDVNYVGRSIFNQKSDLKTTYESDEEIKQVRIGNRVIWSMGERISSMTSNVYNTSHAYVGDMPANLKTVEALDMPHYIGPFKSELQTSEEPYCWKICLLEEVYGKEQETKEQLMMSFACVLLAVIENLDSVEYEYILDGETKLLAIDTEQATHSIGIDVKACGKEVALLEKLIRETSLNLYTYNHEIPKEMQQEALHIELLNCTETPIANWSLTYYLDGEARGSQQGMNANESLVKVGETISFLLTPEDFADEIWDDVDTMEVEITICDENGKEYKVEGINTIQKEFWVSYKFVLLGNPKDGFAVTQ